LPSSDIQTEPNRAKQSQTENSYVCSATLQDSFGVKINTGDVDPLKFKSYHHPKIIRSSDQGLVLRSFAPPKIIRSSAQGGALLLRTLPSENTTNHHGASRGLMSKCGSILLYRSFEARIDKVDYLRIVSEVFLTV
jgi:hypothetical protein